MKTKKHIIKEFVGPAMDMEQVETRAQVNEMHELLQKTKDENKTLNMFQFAINPESFSQSVENLFHLAFLVKDGLASTNEIDKSSSIPIVKISKPPTMQESGAGLSERRQQCVVAFDYDAWEKLKEGLKMNQSIVPNRNAQERAQRRQKELERLNAELAKQRQNGNNNNNNSSQAKSKKRKAPSSASQRQSQSLGQSQQKQQQTEDQNSERVEEQDESPLKKKQRRN